MFTKEPYPYPINKTKPLPNPTPMNSKNFHLTKFHFIKHGETTIQDIISLCTKMTEQEFFYKSEQWSIAENLEHLSLTLHKSWLGVMMPKIFLKLKFGKPVRESFMFEDFNQLYHQKLDEGYELDKKYEPLVKPGKGVKEKLIARFETMSTRYMDQLKYYWEEENIDLYQVPHPLLGMISIRELVYFNIIHNTLHYKTMRMRKSEAVEFSVYD
jgi:DinB superfamily